MILAKKTCFFYGISSYLKITIYICMYLLTTPQLFFSTIVGLPVPFGGGDGD